MQNVFDVASLSPPQVTNATKSAVTTTPAADQVSFDLILSMASSESVQNTQYSQNASQENEPASTNVERAANSISNTRNEEIQDRKEIEKKEFEKPSNNKKTNDDDEIKEESVAVMSNNQEVENQDQTDSNDEVVAANLESSTVLLDGPETKNSIGFSSDQKSAEIVGEQVLDNEVVTKKVDILDSSMSNENTEEVAQKILVDEEKPVSMEKTDLGNETEEDALNVKNGVFTQESGKTEKTDVEAVNLDKTSKNQKVEASMKDETGSTKSVENASQQNLETSKNIDASDDSATNAKDEKIETKANVKSDAAPPGSITTENVPTNATVSQVTQLSEPARLAEAPKTEVVTQITNEIDQMVKTNRSSLRVQLYPEELGHIDLKIVSTKNGVGVTMIADKASTQEVLKSEMNSLKQTIEQAGIQLNDLNVGHGQNSNQHLYEENRHAAKSYASMSSEKQSSETIEKSVTLQTSVVDYKV